MDPFIDVDMQGLTSVLNQLVAAINSGGGGGGGGGNTILNGTTAPSNVTGANGDFYINTTTHFIYGPKVGGIWPSGVSLIGTTGATGAAGTNGNTVLTGNGAPGGGVGANGDMYIDITNWLIYGPKASGSWPSGHSLIGPSGSASAGGSTGQIQVNSSGSLAGITTGSSVTTALGVNVGSAGAFVVQGGALGTPASGTLSACSSLPISTGVSGLGTGVATALAVQTNAAGGLTTPDGVATLTNKTYDTAGAGNTFKIAGTAITSISGNTGKLASCTGSLQNGHVAAFDASGNIVDGGTLSGGGNVSNVGTPSSGQLAQWTGATTIQGIALGTGVATALGTSVGSAGAFVTLNGALGTPSSGTLSSCTGLPISSGVSGLGANVATALGVAIGSAGAPVLVNGVLGTPSSGTLSSCTGLPISTGVSGLGTGVATALATAANAAGGFDITNGTSTLTNKTIDTASNTIKLAGTTITGKSGTTGVVATTSGTLTSGHVAAFDASGNIVDGGAGGGAGSLTVNTTTTSGGAAGQLMYDDGSKLQESALSLVMSTGIWLHTIMSGDATGGGWEFYRDGTSARTRNVIDRRLVIDLSQITVASDATIGFGPTAQNASPGADIYGANDTTLTRAAAGVLRVSGTSTSTVGLVLTVPTTVSGLPSASGIKGARAFVTDANASTFNTTAAGGGSNNVPVFSDGTNWKIG